MEFARKTATGRVAGSDVNSPTTFIRYASEQLGFPVPVGPKARGMFFKRLSEEMEFQGWTWAHLVAAVRYMKAHRIFPRSYDYIFHHVRNATGFIEVDDEDFQQRVAEALYRETDEAWVRKLSLARGEAQRLVYKNWEEQRGSKV